MIRFAIGAIVVGGLGAIGFLIVQSLSKSGRAAIDSVLDKPTVTGAEGVRVPLRTEPTDWGATLPEGDIYVDKDAGFTVGDIRASYPTQPRATRPQRRSQETRGGSNYVYGGSGTYGGAP